jgi:hypothetical protein
MTWMSTSATPPWPPRTEEQLLRALHGKVLEESHVLDLKRELESSESARKKIACDLAAFSVDGGTIVIGVDETVPMSLNAFELTGVGERVEQIGLSRVDEPVYVTTYDIESAADPTRGYVVVEVPVSGRAPHMADGRYYSRGDKTNVVLSDAEVMRWHAKKITEQRDVTAEAAEFLKELTRTSGGSPLFNILIIAKPMGARDDFLMALSTSTSWKTDAAQLLFSAAVAGHEPRSSLFSPTQMERHPEGILAVAELTQPSAAAGTNRAELIFEESGKLTLRSGGLMKHIAGSSPARHGIREPYLIAHIELVVHLAALLSTYGFNGSWQFVVATTGMGKSLSYTLSVNPNQDDSPPVYRSATYERATVASLKQITDAPQSVVRDLVSKLLRSIGSEGEWPWLF